MPRTRILRTGIAGLLAALLVAVGFGPAFADTADPAKGGIEISFGDLQPVGAKVNVFNGGTYVKAVVVGADSPLLLGDLTPGDYQLTMPRASDASPAAPGNFFPGVLDPDQMGTIPVVAGSVAVVQWNVPRPATVAGVVRDVTTGSPLSGLMVVARTADNGEYVSSSTDAAGRYSISGLLGGTYQVEFGNAGAYTDYVFQRGEATVALGETIELDADLVHRGSITGAITFPDFMNGPVRVDLFGPDTRSAQITRADPTFSFQFLDPGTYYMRFSGGRYDIRTTWLGGASTSVDSQRIVVGAGEAVKVTDTLVRPYSDPRAYLEGTVTGPDGEAVDDVGVELWDADGALRVSDVTVKGGVFTFPYLDIPAGRYRIHFVDGSSTGVRARYDSLWYGGKDLATAEVVDLGAGQTTRINVKLTRTIPADSGTINGRITSAGVGLAGAQVRIERPSPDGSWPGVLTTGYSDGQGRYTIKGLKAGNYIVEVGDRPLWNRSIVSRYVGGTTNPAAATQITVSADGTATADLDLGRKLTTPDVSVVRGRVTDPLTGAGIPDALVRFISSAGAWSNTWTDSSGRYEYESDDGFTGTVEVEQAAGHVDSATRSVSVALGSVAFADFSLQRTMTTTAPKVPSSFRVGVRAVASVTGWTSGAVLSYQWRRDGTAIKGATGSSYTPTASDRDRKLTVSVTGRRTGYATTTRASTAHTVAAGILTSSTPKITGTKRYGYSLTAAPGTWTSGTTFTYQWYRGGVAIKGAVYKSHRLTSGDVAHTITVKVTGHKSGYTTVSRTSAKTSLVTW